VTQGLGQLGEAVNFVGKVLKFGNHS
jgi:hypothetical protein